jgi:hypothetical protein
LANDTVFHPLAPGLVPASGVFAKTWRSFGASIEMVYGVLKPGSSKQGNARRALVDSNWVKMYQSPFSSWR